MNDKKNNGFDDNKEEPSHYTLADFVARIKDTQQKISQLEPDSKAADESDLTDEESDVEKTPVTERSDNQSTSSKGVSHEDAIEAKKFIRSNSLSEPDSYSINEELDKLTQDIDGHLSEFLDEALTEFREKTSAREIWSNRIWDFTISLVIGTVVLLAVNYWLSNYWLSKPIVTEKLLYVLVGGMFAQIISLMLIVMKYVFSPSKDVYSYLTELVKARKLKNGYGDSPENGDNSNK